MQPERRRNTKWRRNSVAQKRYCFSEAALIIRTLDGKAITSQPAQAATASAEVVSTSLTETDATANPVKYNVRENIRVNEKSCADC